MDKWLITIMIFLPLAGVAGQVLLGRKPGEAGPSRWMALGTSLCSSFIGMFLVGRLYGMAKTAGGPALTEKLDWVGSFAITYAVSVDGLNALVVLLVSLVFPVLLVSEWARERGARGLYGLFLLLQSSFYGIACAQDLFLLFFFWTLSSLPFYFLISLWGGEEREQAGFRYIMTAAFGNALLFFSILLIYYSVDPNTFLLEELAGGRLSGIRFDFLGASLPVATLAFALLCLAMILRIPVWPFHSWFSYFIRQAPPSVAVALSGVFVPVAIYVFVRVSYGLFPFSMSEFYPILVGVGVFNVVIGAIGAVAQRDFRLFQAFLCLTQTGLLLVGASSMDSVGVMGAVYQFFSLGLGVSGLGLFFGLLRDRTEKVGLKLDGEETKNAGFAGKAPVMAVMTGMILASLLGFPGFGGFIGQSLIYMGGYSVHPVTVLMIGLGGLFMALAFFSVYMRIFLGRYPDGVHAVADLSGREKGFLFPVVFTLLVLGIYPKPLLELVKPSVASLMELIK